MKLNVRIQGFLILFLISPVMYSQKDCKVLKAEISASYVGECKQGLANGEGEGKGIDYYKGEFFKGYPEGKGTYIWKNGAVYNGEWKKGLRDGKGDFSLKTNGKDSTLNGYWIEDKYIGESKPPPPYIIEYRNNVGRVSCMRVGDRPYIKYLFSRNGSELNNITNVLMQGSSGSEKTQTSFTGFESVTFPFNGKVTFNAPNSFLTSVMSCELRITVNQPGAWVVTIFY